MRQSGIAGQIQRLSKWIVRAVRAGGGGNAGVLVISNDGCDPIGRLCGRLGWKLNYASDLAIGLEKLRKHGFDVIIYDQNLSDQDWRMAVTSLAAIAPWSSILLLSPRGHPELWNEVIRHGGYDILGNPISEDGAESALGMAMARAQLRSSLDKRKMRLAEHRAPEALAYGDPGPGSDDKNRLSR